MNQKTIFVLFITIFIVIAVLFYVKPFNGPKNISPSTSENESTLINDDTSTSAEPGTAVLFGSISDIKMENEKSNVTIKLIESVKGQDDQELAALVDGTCTLDQIEKNTCLNNPVYLRKTSKKISLSLNKDADIRLYAREARGGMKVDVNGQVYLEQISVQDFVAMLQNTDDAPWLKDIFYDFTTSQGVVMRIQERYSQ